MRYTRADVLEREAREHEALERLLANLRAGDWARLVQRPETRDPWTVKDAVAHILHWKQHTVRRIRGFKAPAEERGLTITESNRRVYERWRQRPVKEMLAWHHQVHAEAVAALNELPEDWFTGRERGPDWLGESSPPVWMDHDPNGRRGCRGSGTCPPKVQAARVLG